MNNPIELLDQIKKVDAPPFLVTRIRQKIENSRQSRFSTGISWSLGISLLVVVVLNITIMMKQTHSTKTAQDSNLAVAMNLIPTNSLY